MTQEKRFKEILIGLLVAISQVSTIGKITSDEVFSIEQTYSNIDEIANYRFSIKFDVLFRNGGYFEIIFPRQFGDNPDFIQTITCSAKCVGFTNIVYLLADHDYYPGLTYSFQIFGIRNPNWKTGIGKFILRAKQGENLIAESKLYGSIGISGIIGELVSTTVALASVNSGAGDFAKYVVSFKVLSAMPKDFNIILELPPNTFKVAQNPSCSLFPVNGVLIKGNLNCLYDNGVVKMEGFEQDIEENSNIGIIISLQNPPKAMITSTFGILAFKKNTSFCFFKKRGIKGVAIAPGQIEQIKLIPKDALFSMTKRKLMWLRLSFKLQNDLEVGSKIELYIPNGFSIYQNPTSVLGVPWSFYVENGLDDESANKRLTLSYFTRNGQDAIRISSLTQSKQSFFITIAFLLTLPNSSGLSWPIEIWSFSSTGQEIDKNTKDAVISVIDVTYPLSFKFSVSSSTTDGVSMLDISLIIACDKTIPLGSVFEFLIDDKILIGDIQTSNCLIFNTVLNAYSPASKCWKKDRYIYMTMNVAFDLGISYNLKLVKVIKSPTYTGNYYFQVEIRSPKSKVLQSFSSVVSFAPGPFNSPAINLFPVQIDQQSIMDARFITTFDLYASYFRKSSIETISYLQFQFVGSVIDPSLGMGYASGSSVDIPCLSVLGLVPYVGTKINCTLIVGTSPIIEIKNYQSVSKNSQISILIPNIKNPNGSWNLYIRSIVQSNRLNTILSESIIPMTTNLIISNGIVTDYPESNPNFYRISSKSLGYNFDIAHDIVDNTPLPPKSKIIFQLPTYDTGFLGSETLIACSILSITLRCYQFAGIDWIYIELDQNSITTTPTSTVSLRNLRWPVIALNTLPPSIRNSLRLIDEFGIVIKIVNYPRFPLTQAESFSLADIILDKKEQNRVDATYMFVFACNVPIPKGSTLIVNFPSIYNLLASNPSIEVISQDLSRVSVNGKLLISNTAQSITIDNLGSYPANLKFKINVIHVRNPITSDIVDGFSVYIKKGVNLVAQKTNFISFNLQGMFTSGSVSIFKLYSYPNNKDVDAVHVFEFSLKSMLSIGGEIYVQFPEEYFSLPNNVVCYISGALETFQSCRKKQRSIYIVLNSNYNTGKIRLEVIGIRNPLNPSTSPFKIYSSYDSQIIDSTGDDASDSLIINFIEEPLKIKLKSFDYEPRNEAEEANYKISFYPSKNIRKGSSCLIIFPESYDRNLGKFLEIEVISGLTGKFLISTSNRVVTISNFEDFNVNFGSAISIELRGIVNPNKPNSGKAGFISVAIDNLEKTGYLMYLEKAALIEPYDAPIPLDFISLKIDPAFARIKATYNFIFSVQETIPNNNGEGMILIQLPEEFPSQSTNFTNCSQWIVDTAILRNCSISQKTIKMSGFNSSISGNLNLTIESIENPFSNITTSAFSIKTFDNSKKRIFEKTSDNLNFINSFYIYPGPLFSVNKGKGIYVERGAQSVDIELVLSEICSLNLTIIGSNEFIRIQPQALMMTIGMQSLKFRVSVPEETDISEYFIEWKIYGDFDSPLYTPIEPTKVIVTGNRNIPISVEEIKEIPIRGNSLAVMVQTEYAPDIGFEVELNFVSTISCLYFNNSKLVFESGQNEAYFSLQYIEDNTDCYGLQSGLISLELKGVNYKIYMLEKLFLRFNVVEKTNRNPEILDLLLTSSTKTTATIFFTVSEVSTAYAYVALFGTSMPNIKEIKSKGPPLADTFEQQYFVVNVGLSLSGQIIAENLEPETLYVVYIYLETREYIVSEVATSMTFFTKPKDNSAFVILEFMQSYINSVEKSIIFDYVAFLLSLKAENVQEKLYAYDFELLNNMNTIDDGQSTSSGAIKTKVAMAVIPDFKSEIYPPPVQHAMMILKKKSQMKIQFPNFNIEAAIPIYEFKRFSN
jgi:hypothetical protein